MYFVLQRIVKKGAITQTRNTTNRLVMIFTLPDRLYWAKQCRHDNAHVTCSHKFH